MSEGWETKCLGEVVEFQRGLTYSKSDEVSSSSNIVLRANNVDLSSNTLDLSELRHISDAIEVPASKKLRRGSLLICTASGSKSHLGKVALIDTDCDYAFGGFMGQLTPKTSLESKYLFYFMISDRYREHIRQISDGININNLKFDDLRPLKIPVPSVPEQQRIVTILDEAFAGLATATANTEKNLKNARELFDSYLGLIFSLKGKNWIHKSLAEVSSEFGRGKSTHRPRNAPSLYGGKYPFIQTGDVRNADHLVLEYSQTYNEKGLAQSKLWPKGTICITIAANIAETGILGFDACFPDSVIGMVVDPSQSNNKLVEYLLQFFKAELQAQGKGSAQDNINLATFKNQKFPFPPLKVQNKLVKELDEMAEQTRRLKASYEARLLSITDLKQSILQRAFTGELSSPPSSEIQEAAE